MSASILPKVKEICSAHKKDGIYFFAFLALLFQWVAVVWFVYIVAFVPAADQTSKIANISIGISVLSVVLIYVFTRICSALRGVVGKRGSLLFFLQSALLLLFIAVFSLIFEGDIVIFGLKNVCFFVLSAEFVSTLFYFIPLVPKSEKIKEESN